MTGDEFDTRDDTISAGRKDGLSIVLIVLIAFIAGAAGGFLTVKFMPPEPKIQSNTQQTPTNGNNSTHTNITTHSNNTTTPTPNPNNSVDNPAVDNSAVDNTTENPINESEIKGKTGLLEFHVLTNINDLFAMRHIEVELKLVIADKEILEKIKQNKMLMASLKHEIHMILSAKSSKDLKGTAGKMTLFEEIMMRGNELIKEELGREPITRVMHTLWRIQ